MVPAQYIDEQIAQNGWKEIFDALLAELHIKHNTPSSLELLLDEDFQQPKFKYEIRVTEDEVVIYAASSDAKEIIEVLQNAFKSPENFKKQFAYSVQPIQNEQEHAQEKTKANAANPEVNSVPPKMTVKDPNTIFSLAPKEKVEIHISTYAFAEYIKFVFQGQPLLRVSRDERNLNKFKARPIFLRPKPPQNSTQKKFLFLIPQNSKMKGEKIQKLCESSLQLLDKLAIVNQGAKIRIVFYNSKGMQAKEFSVKDRVAIEDFLHRGENNVQGANTPVKTLKTVLEELLKDNQNTNDNLIFLWSNEPDAEVVYREPKPEWICWDDSANSYVPVLDGDCHKKQAGKEKLEAQKAVEKAKVQKVMAEIANILAEFENQGMKVPRGFMVGIRDPKNSDLKGYDGENLNALAKLFKTPFIHLNTIHDFNEIYNYMDLFQFGQSFENFSVDDEHFTVPMIMDNKVVKSPLIFSPLEKDKEVTITQGGRSFKVRVNHRKAPWPNNHDRLNQILAKMHSIVAAKEEPSHKMRDLMPFKGTLELFPGKYHLYDPSASPSELQYHGIIYNQFLRHLANMYILYARHGERAYDFALESASNYALMSAKVSYNLAIDNEARPWLSMSLEPKSSSRKDLNPGFCLKSDFKFALACDLKPESAKNSAEVEAEAEIQTEVEVEIEARVEVIANQMASQVPDSVVNHEANEPSPIQRKILWAKDADNLEDRQTSAGSKRYDIPILSLLAAFLRPKAPALSSLYARRHGMNIRPLTDNEVVKEIQPELNSTQPPHNQQQPNQAKEIAQTSTYKDKAVLKAKNTITAKCRLGQMHSGINEKTGASFVRIEGVGQFSSASGRSHIFVGEHSNARLYDLKPDDSIYMTTQSHSHDGKPLCENTANGAVLKTKTSIIETDQSCDKVLPLVKPTSPETLEYDVINALGEVMTTPFFYSSLTLHGLAFIAAFREDIEDLFLKGLAYGCFHFETSGRLPETQETPVYIYKSHEDLLEMRKRAVIPLHKTAEERYETWKKVVAEFRAKNAVKVISDIGEMGLRVLIEKDLQFTESSTRISKDFIKLVTNMQKDPMLYWDIMARIIDLSIINAPKALPSLIDKASAFVPQGLVTYLGPAASSWIHGGFHSVAKIMPYISVSGLSQALRKGFEERRRSGSKLQGFLAFLDNTPRLIPGSRVLLDTGDKYFTPAKKLVDNKAKEKTTAQKSTEVTKDNAHGLGLRKRRPFSQ